MSDNNNNNTNILNTGYFSIELNHLQLTFFQEPSNELSIKVDVEIVDSISTGLFKFYNNNDTKYSSDIRKAYHQPIEYNNNDNNNENNTNNDNKEAPIVDDTPKPTSNFILGLENTFLRSTYLDLNSTVISALANSIISIKVLNASGNDSNTAAAPAPAKGKAPAPTTAVVGDEMIIELSLPMSELLSVKGNIIECNKLNECSSIQINTNPKYSLSVPDCVLSCKILCDNDLSEYVMGASIITWEGASLLSIPSTWGLKYNDVIDPKAKVPPTATELRAKYLENIPKLVETQDKVANFVITIGIPNDPIPNEQTEEGEEIPVTQPPPPIFPELKLANGKIAYDSELAAQVAEEEDIRARGDLWSIKWSIGSSKLFFHRSEARALLSNVDESAFNLNVKVTRIPTAEAAAVEGAELTAIGVVNVSSFFQPGIQNATFKVLNLSGGDFNDDVQFDVTLGSNIPTVPSKSTIPPSSIRPADVISMKQVASKSIHGNKDVLKELQEEIANVISTIAQEYVNMYPVSQAQVEAEAKQAADQGQPQMVVTLAERRSAFMHYLSTHGIYHSFKEKLKPKIQRVVRDKYGPRGQALNKNGLSLGLSGENGPFEQMLADLYIFLVKESSKVLNKMYGNTMIDRDEKELEKVGVIDDEVESLPQLFTKLEKQANDAEGDRRYQASEQYHLERIQMVSNHAVLGSQPEVVHDAYLRYGEFLLRLSNAMKLQASCAPLMEQEKENLGLDVYLSEPTIDESMLSSARQHFARAREALQIAVSAKNDVLKANLLLASILIEFDQPEAAGDIITNTLKIELNKVSNKGGINSLDDFNGYETDKLCPIDPLYYSILAAYYSLQGKPKVLATRKALRLLNKSFIDGNYSPPVTTHGVPRRTIVLVLSNAAIFLFDYGLNTLGQECVKLAISCENAVTDKAQSRNLPACTVPFIRHALRRSQAMSSYLTVADTNTNKGTEKKKLLDDALSKAKDSILVATDNNDIISGYILTATLLSSLRGDPNDIVDNYLNAIKISLNDTSCNPIPVSAYIEVGKLLIALGRYEEAKNTLLASCKVHTYSSAIFLLIGIACLRLDKMQDAEDALQEANLCDNKNADVWAYLALVCLQGSIQGLGTRHYEGEKALMQSLRLGLTSSSLLRELALAFMSIDKLNIAEDLVRRALVTETGKGNSHTRKLLADLLTSQNNIVNAVEEYRSIIGDDFADYSLKIQSGEKCASLLSSLGRTDELKVLKNILNDLKNNNTAQ